MISQLFNLRQYSGGPHFDRLSTLCFDLEGVAFEFTQPASDLVMQDPPRMLNFPFNMPGWFKSHCERRNIRDFVHIYTEIWNYYPVRTKRLINLLAMGTNERMGCLSVGIHLNQVQGGKSLDLANPHSLSEYIKWEYDDYYESPVRGDYGKGRNYAVRTEFGDILARKGEHYRHQYEAALENGLEPTPEHFDLRDFGGGQWTCFALRRGWTTSNQYYCIPLSASYYLHIHIELRFEISDRNKDLLEPDMLSTAEWLRQHIKITFPGKPTGPLALPH